MNGKHHSTREQRHQLDSTFNIIILCITFDKFGVTMPFVRPEACRMSEKKTIHSAQGPKERYSQMSVQRKRAKERKGTIHFKHSEFSFSTLCAPMYIELLLKTSVRRWLNFEHWVNVYGRHFFPNSRHIFLHCAKFALLLLLLASGSRICAYRNTSCSAACQPFL